MRYNEVLPDSFPYVLPVKTERAREIINLLIESRPGMPSGTSFAITSDPFDSSDDIRRLWLSRASVTSLATVWPDPSRSREEYMRSLAKHIAIQADRKWRCED